MASLTYLIKAGGGAYVFAKRSINADKKARHEEETKRRRLKESLDAEYLSKPSKPKGNHRKPVDHASSPSSEASKDLAASGHPEDNAANKSDVDNQYLATKPYRSRKGDRFS